MSDYKKTIKLVYILLFCLKGKKFTWELVVFYQSSFCFFAVFVATGVNFVTLPA